MCSGFCQWYQWYTTIVQGSTNGNIGKTIGTNGNANGTNGKPMVPLLSQGNGTVSKITNGTVGKPRTEPLFRCFDFIINITALSLLLMNLFEFLILKSNITI